MRVGWSIVLLSGCLAVPADPVDAPDGDGRGDRERDGGARAADGAALTCADGTTLDLVFVDHLSVEHDNSDPITLAGMAVFANPGEDTVLLAGMSANLVGGDPNLSTGISMNAGLDLNPLPPGEAKGVLSGDAQTVVLPALGESWTDDTRPGITLDLVVVDDAAFDDTGELSLPFEVRSTGYRFSSAIRLVESDAVPAGTPLSAGRVTARCE